ncbi:hypothetical protein ACMFMG_006340 [Clarireedia jacksonii]
MEGVDDPWHWSVDRVVQEFCTDKRSWDLRAASTTIPDPVILENALRDHEVSGDVLLIDINDKTLREDLNIKKLGWRSYIQYGVEQLRSRSPKYHSKLLERSIQTGPLSEHNVSFQGFPRHPDFNFTINSSVPITTDSGTQNSPSLQPLQLLSARSNGPATSPSRMADCISDASGSKRQKLNDHFSHQVLVDIPEVPVVGHQEAVPDVDVHNDTTSHEAGQTKKRKRVAPTLITAIVDKSLDRTIPTEADNVRIHRGDILPSSLDTLDGESNKPKELQTLGYLGLERLSVDDVFYHDIPLGEKITSEDIVTFGEHCSTRIPSGRRLYVHGLIRRFLLAKPDAFQRNQKTFVAVRPYQMRLAPTSQNVSFTLYQPTQDNEITVTREKLSSWPEIDPDARVIKPTKIGDITVGINSNREMHAEAADLYSFNGLDDDDELLPAWGDSEYDSEELGFFNATAEEEEDDHRPKGNIYLTPEEIGSAIDDGIADIVAKWQEKKLPKRRQKAFRLWMTSRRKGTRRAQIQKAKSELKHLVQKRLPELREHILRCQWTEAANVRRQTGSFEATIFDREDLIFTIALLESTVPPPRFTEQLVPKAKDSAHRSYTSESGESINSDSSHNESIGAMSDFVMEELDLADDEEDVTMSDIDEIEPPRTPLTSIAKNSSRPSTEMTVGQIQNQPQSQGNSQDDLLSSPVPIATPVVARIKSEQALLERQSSSLVPVGSSRIISLISSDEGTPPSVKPKLKLINRKSPVTISSSSDKEQDHKTLPPDLKNLPSFTTPASIAHYEYQTWEKLKDRNRLVITVVYELSNAHQKTLLSFTASLNRDTCRMYMEELIASSGLTMGDADRLSALKTLVRLFWIYIDCRFHAEEQGWFQSACAVIGNHWHMCENFYILAHRLDTYFNPKIRLTFSPQEQSPTHHTIVDDESEDGEPVSIVRRRPRNAISSNDDEYLSEPKTPSRNKKRLIEDASARDLREQDKERQAAQEMRRKQLRERLAQFGSVENVDLHRHIINEGKFDDQGYIYIEEEIGKRIKPHQLEGVRFIWNQITADGKATQGCLLAHTMGLGKTMQAITVLVALAQAALSPEPNVSSQVPQSLRVSRTIILCPPTLIDNWIDELLTWAPGNLLGDLLKIDASLKPLARLRTIEQWYHDGGVLIIGYEMFRDFVSNQLSKKAQIDPAKWDQARKQLLEGPNIIIADEAHRLKNASAAVTLAASQFKSKTRIALTGSPLANNVEEYHTMIEWVAPNYLGPITEFRAKYKDPIEQGLYIDSTSYEKRKSLKMLNVLNEDLSPKVNRANMSVLRADLPPKKEFVIMCSLTKLQKHAYITYVRSMSASNNIPLTKSGEVKSATMLSYLGILSLLCSHPYCFKAKLEERVQDAQHNSTLLAVGPADAQDITDEDGLLESSAWKTGATEDLITQEQKLFHSVNCDLKSIDLSNKVKILCQILDASKAVGDKVLVFSQMISTLNFLQDLCMKQGRKFSRLDGKTAMNKRQGLTKKFNSNDKDLFLISTTAGGLGLNLFGANRVVIFDFRYNPIHEEQAIGRAYRIGQTKKVFVYRLMAAGTFESSIHNTAIFKTQLAFRVVDKKNPISWAQKGLGKFLHEPKDVEQQDLSKFQGMDPAVLDKILGPASAEGTIKAIVQSDTFEEDDQDRLTEKEKQEVQNMVKLEQLKRTDPKAYHDLLQKQAAAEALRTQERIREQEALRIQKLPFHSSTAISSAGGRVSTTMPAQNTKAVVSSSAVAAVVVYINKKEATAQNAGLQDQPNLPVDNSPGSPVPELVDSDPATFASACFLKLLKKTSTHKNIFSSAEETETKVRELYRTITEVFESSMDNQKLGEALDTASDIIRGNGDRLSELLSHQLSPEDFLDEVLVRIRSGPPQSHPQTENIQSAEQADTTIPLPKAEPTSVSQVPLYSGAGLVRPSILPPQKLQPQPAGDSGQQSSQSSTDDVLVSGHGSSLHQITQLPINTTTRDINMAEDNQLQQQVCDDQLMAQAALAQGTANGVNQNIIVAHSNSSRAVTIPSSNAKPSVISLSKRLAGWVAGTIPKANMP